MSLSAKNGKVLVTRVRKFRPAPITRLAIILMMGISLMAGCKTASQGGSSDSAGSAASSKSGNFEGVVNMKVETGGNTIEMNSYVRPDRVRTEARMLLSSEVDAIQIMDLTAAKMTTLIPKQKTYMTEDFNEVRAEAGMGQDQDFPKLTATGRTETVAGHSCEHYLMGDQQNMDLCIAKGMGFFGMGGSGDSGGLTDLFSSKAKEKAAANPEWSKFLEGGAFPLKMMVTEGGKTTMNVEVLAILPRKLD